MEIMKWDVELTLTEPLLGTMPLKKEIFSNFIESKKAERVLPPGETAASVELETLPVDEELGVTSFHKNEKGVILYDYVIKGFMKNAANTMKDSLGVLALKSKINDFVFVFPRMINILAEDGSVVAKPDGTLERPLRAMTAQGPRVALAKSDLVNAGRKLTFELALIPGHPFTTKKKGSDPETILKTCLEYGRFMGLGQWRNGSYGRFEVKKFEAKA